MVKTYKVDTEALAKDPEIVFGALEDCWNEGDIQGFMLILRDIARRKGMTKVSRKVGIQRTAAYNTLSENGNPRLSTFVPLMKELGIQPSFHAA